MSRSRRALSGSFVLGLLVAAVAWGQGQTVGITFQNQAVVAGGLTPGASVAWFSVEYRIDAEYSSDLTQRYAVGTAAADGTARLDLAQPPAPRSYWMAVDLGTGAYALATPNNYRIAKAPSPPTLDTTAAAQSDALVETRQYVMGLLVRPGVGAWTFGASDGNSIDQDGEVNGHLRVALDRLTPLTNGPAAPEKAAPNDLWLIVDPSTMEITVLKGGVAQ
jgi:hypothetical protein